MARLAYLTYDQIDEIIDSLPLVTGSNLISRRRAQDDIRNSFKLLFSNQKIVDDPRARQMLQRTIFEMYTRAMSIPGTAVGVKTAETLGKEATQAALNSFHHSGTEKGAVSGLEKTRELLAATRKKLRDEHIRTCFNNDYYSFKDIFDLYPHFVGTHVHHLIIENKITTFEDAYNPEMYNFYTRVNDYPENYINPEDHPICFQIRLDILKMYRSRITAARIVEALMECNQDVLRCIAYPTQMGMIHIYPDARKIIEKYQENFKNQSISQEEDKIRIIKIFILNILLRNTKLCLVSGIQGITGIEPVKVNISTVFKSVSIYRYENNVHDDKIMVRLNPGQVRLNGLKMSRIINYFTALGYKLIYAPENRRNEPSIAQQVQRMDFPESMLVFQIQENMKVTDYRRINDYVSSLDETSEDYINYFFFYALIEGTNMMDVLSHSLVDPTRSISNNPLVVAQNLGIGAASLLLTEKYNELFGGNGINPRYIGFLVKHQTSSGIYMPVTSRNRQYKSPMVSASFQDATQCFVKAAAAGTYESLDAVSSAIYFGKRITLGTGAMQIAIHPMAEQWAIYPQVFTKRLDKNDIVTDDANEQLNVGDEIRDSGNFNMPPNQPAPSVPGCTIDLPAFFIDLIPVDTYTTIRSILNSSNVNFNIYSYLETPDILDL